MSTYQSDQDLGSPGPVPGTSDAGVPALREGSAGRAAEGRPGESGRTLRAGFASDLARVGPPSLVTGVRSQLAGRPASYNSEGLPGN